MFGVSTALRRKKHNVSCVAEARLQSQHTTRRVLEKLGQEHLLILAGNMARAEYKDVCTKALRYRGLRWWRWSQLHRKLVEKDKCTGPHPGLHPQRFNIFRGEDAVAAVAAELCGNPG